MTSYSTIDVTCPCCEEATQATSLHSTNSLGGKHTDFHGRAVGFPPVPFLVSTCLHCGYSGFLKDFTEPNPIPEAVKTKIYEELTPRIRDYVRPPDDMYDTGSVYDLEAAIKDHVKKQGIPPKHGWMRYEFTALIATWQGAPANKIADLYLRAAWCCLYDGTDEQEVHYRVAAIDYFEQALEAGEVGEEQEPTITYLVGELYRRVGNPEVAEEWFNKVIARAETDSNWQNIASLAVQQRDDPQEMMPRRR